MPGITAARLSAPIAMTSITVQVVRATQVPSAGLTRTTIYRTRSLFLSCAMPSAPRWLEAINKALTHPDNKGKIGTQ